MKELIRPNPINDDSTENVQAYCDAWSGTQCFSGYQTGCGCNSDSWHCSAYYLNNDEETSNILF